MREKKKRKGRGKEKAEEEERDRKTWERVDLCTDHFISSLGKSC